MEIGLPSGRRVSFPVESCRLAPGDAAQAGAAGGGIVWAEAVVVKDAGDDPDVTDGAHLTALVSWRGEPGMELDGGMGVGIVTKPGLGLELGGPAINPVPRKMITEAVGEAVDLAEHGLRVIISVPDGERMARKTTNGRLGILGGISILGTTGIVRPFSTASWRASVEQAVAVLCAQGEQSLVLCTGGRTEKGAMALLPGPAGGVFRGGGRLHRRGAAPGRAARGRPGGLRRHGGKADQAGGRGTDDALHPLEGLHRAARRHHPRGRRQR